MHALTLPLLVSVKTECRKRCRPCSGASTSSAIAGATRLLRGLGSQKETLCVVSGAGRWRPPVCFMHVSSHPAWKVSTGAAQCTAGVPNKHKPTEAYLVS
ncbi:hypothetical protein NDU88_007162 [Pleurodeles waltl]|uniref:Secreted protein n=1 Tax=Pleurodeles waltl TaxID=8319 RepID=A0AAV7NU61_PLEWA|nr:hypothetical protein NDU88_007162 [Pleurodeles waltl]